MIGFVISRNSSCAADEVIEGINLKSAKAALLKVME
jgi:hypothetical protein